jgi:hypothetical protein
MQDKMKSNWNIINTETGRTRKQNNTQYLMGKSCVQNPAATINKYLITCRQISSFDLKQLGQSSGQGLLIVYGTGKQTNSVTFSPQANYTD